MATKFEYALLFVDDDPLLHQSLKLIVPPQWRVISCQKLEDVPYSQFFHLAIVDMHLDEKRQQPAGLEVIEKLHQAQPLLEIFGASGDWNQPLWEQALKKGAQRFLAKPWSPEEVVSLLEKAEALWSLRSASRKNLKTQWIGNSDYSQSLRKKLSQLRGEKTPVLIEGETGSGKEVIAQILHQQEGTRPLVTVNVSAIPDSLFESEMFGHIKGSFTGADQNKVGLIEASHGGDLFLDEIEDFPLHHQAKLLRFIESGELRKVGAKENFRVQTRILAASNRPLEALVREGKFREDLYFRLSATKIQVLPLRERLDDIAEIAQFFLGIERPRRNKSWTSEALEALKSHRWPGNVRELKRVCEQLSLSSPLPLIRAEDVSAFLSPQSHSQPIVNWDYSLGLDKMVEMFEAQAIQNYLKAEPDVEKAAVGLKISKSNLYKKIKDYGLKAKGELC